MPRSAATTRLPRKVRAIMDKGDTFVNVRKKLRGAVLIRVIAVSVMLGVATMPAIAADVYTQPYDGIGNLFASQNDTSSGGYGVFATTYDNFTLATTMNITGATWVGGYFNPATTGTITAYTLQIYADNAGTPGAVLQSESITGNAAETVDAGGAPIYDYTAVFSSPFTASAGQQYWLSIVPDTAYPPQWGWATGTGGDGAAYQDYMGSGAATVYDMAFTLQGAPVPEPAFYQLGALLALGGLGALRLRKRA
jgi:hypothetical protein